MKLKISNENGIVDCITIINEQITKWVLRCEMSHVLQKFPIKLFFHAFV